MDLSVIIPARKEEANLVYLLPRVHQILSDLAIDYEIIVIDEIANPETIKITKENHVTLLIPQSNGYGAALRAGFEEACGTFIVTMDADLSHSPNFLISLWNSRKFSDIVIASRYVRDGKAIMPLSRFLLSKILNLIFSRGLDLNVKDMSSGYRLYKASILKNRKFTSIDFDILQEVLVLAMIEGFSVLEIPFTYQPRIKGSSHARVFKFGIKYIQTFSRLWKIRNSIASADYDARAFYTWVPPQRYWQRKRYKYISTMIDQNNRCLDVGCGSSRILGALPDRSIGLDIQMRKLRFSRCYQKQYINGSALSLPIASNSIKCVICSEVIEHVPRGEILSELDRVLCPGGLLVLGTPDYSKWEWNLIEKLYKLMLPQAYADEHITHYKYQEIIDEFISKRGYRLEERRYILQAELILSLRKCQ
jgi:dolichol-phosphate mannosyltransferase